MNEASCSDERGFMLIRNKQFPETMSSLTLAFASHATDHARADRPDRSFPKYSQDTAEHLKQLGKSVAYYEIPGDGDHTPTRCTTSARFGGGRFPSFARHQVELGHFVVIAALAGQIAQLPSRWS
jgi:hypothetical protein